MGYCLRLGILLYQPPVPTTPILAPRRSFLRQGLRFGPSDRVSRLSTSLRCFCTRLDKLLDCSRPAPRGDALPKDAYNDFCAAQGWQAVTVRQFESQVCDHMVSIHHAHKRTDIKRNDKNQRGYARVSLQDAADLAPSPAPAPQETVPF